MYASRERLSRWLERESSIQEPVYIANEYLDLSADIKRALSYVRESRQR